MKNILNKLFATKSEDVSDTNCNFFDLIINKDFPLPKIQININDTSVEAAEQFAKAMVLLHHGVYYSDLLDLIYELSQRSEEYHRFCYALTMHLKNNIDVINQHNSEIKSDLPLVKPSSFSGK